MKRLKSVMTFLLICLSAMSVFAAGQQDGSGSAKKVEVWMINSPVAEIIQAFDEVAVAFEEETGIAVEYIRIPTNDFHTKLTTSLSAGVYPDMIIWNSSPGVQFENTGLISPVDDVVDKAGRDLFGEASLRMFTVNGKLMEIPFMVRPGGIHARKDWLDAAGYDTEPKKDSNGIIYYEGLRTWEDLLQAGMAMNDPSNGKYGMGFPYSRKGFGDSASFLFSVMACYGASLVDEEGNINIDTPKAVEALSYVKKIWDSGVVPAAATTWDGGSNNQFFIGGDIGIVYNSNSIMGKLNDTTGAGPEDLLIVPFPAGPEGANLGAGPESITIFNKKDTSAARTFAEYLLKEDTQVSMFKTMGFGYYSPLKKDVMENDLFSDLDINQQVLMQDSMKVSGVNYMAEPDGRLNALYSSFIFDDALSRIAVDGWDPVRVAAEMASKVDEALND